VRIQANDEDKEPSDISDAVFSIVSEIEPSITVTSPNGSEGWEISSLQTITWTSTGTIDNVTIEYSINSSTSWIEIIASTPNTGSYEWTIPDSPSEYCLVRVSDADADTGPSDTGDSYFSIIPETFDCGEKWTGSYSGNNTFNDIAFGNSKFVTVGQGGTIMTGNGKTAWTPQSSGTTTDLYGITYGNNIFVTVGGQGTILTSPNGTNWTTHSPVTNKDLNQVAYGDNQFVSVGNAGAILTSPDGTTWETQSPGTTADLLGIAYGSGKFTAVGANGVILTSSNGIDWNQNNSGINQTLHDIVYGDNQFLAVGDEGVIITSTNGIHWNLRTADINTPLFSAANGNSIFVIVGQNGKILTGTVETGWDVRESHVRDNLNGTAYGNSQFTAVGAGNILYSLCDTASSTANMINDLPEILNLLPKLRNNLPYENKQGTRDTSLQLISPNGAEVLHPGEKALITWESNKNIDNVKLEYSPDNGTTYLEIIDNFMPPAARGDSFWKKPSPLDSPAKTFDYVDGFPAAKQDVMRYYYEWQVPYHISANCLIRISEMKQRKTPPLGLLYELNFKVTANEPLTNTGEIFSIYPGNAVNQTINHAIPMVSFSNESNGKTYIHWNETTKEIGRLTNFLHRWHNIRIIMDNTYDQVSVILDGSMVFANIPGASMTIFSPAVSFVVGPNNSTAIEIDDVVVHALYSQEESIQSDTSSYPRPYALGTGPPLKFTTIFKEDFERLNEKNSLENNGWRTNSEQAFGSQDKQAAKSVFVNLKPGVASKTLEMQTVPGTRVIAIKRFDIGVDFPFDVSDNPFEIRYNNGMNSDAPVHKPVDTYPGIGGHGTSANYSSPAPAAISSSSKTTPARIQNTTLVDTYYIYSYDGKLLAEYDHNGNCVRDYIYAGNRLIAEYYPPPIDKYYYYMPDQVNSVRIITDDNGDVVYSAAYGPYGEAEKVWNNTYEPELKFSGKERDEYTNLDYFGARYYDHHHYRFNSVDPIINKEEALMNPQLWNLYAYCRNNPITYLDINGMIEALFNWIGIYGPDSGRPNDHSYDHFPGASAGVSNITPLWYVDYTVHTNPDGTSNVTFIFEMDVMMWIEISFLGSGSVEDHIEHEAGHLIQWAILFQERKAFLEKKENVIIQKHGDPHYFAKSAIETMKNKKVAGFENKSTHNRDVNRWAYDNRHRAVPTLGKGVLRYDPKNK
jgi:RHS repeat-associated protein